MMDQKKRERRHPTMADTIKRYLTKIHIGAEQSFKNLSIFPLLSDYSIPFDYLTLDEAVSQDMVEVIEVRRNGSAPRHKVINKSDQMILILNGEKLGNSKQYWNVGATILIPAKETVEIPAKHTKKSRSHHGINRSHSRDHVRASRDYMEHFARVSSQIGALFVINGRVAGMDCFGRSDVLEKTFMKMIEGYAQVAVNQLDPKINLKSSKAEALNFLQMAKESRVRTKPPARLWTGCRLYSKRCSGFALAREDQVLHLSVVAKN